MRSPTRFPRVHSHCTIFNENSLVSPANSRTYRYHVKLGRLFVELVGTIDQWAGSVIDPAGGVALKSVIFCLVRDCHLISIEVSSFFQSYVS